MRPLPQLAIGLAALAMLLSPGCGAEGRCEQGQIPYAIGFGGTCADSIKCPDDSPICVTPTHDEEYGFCSRECSTDLRCDSAAGDAFCSIIVTDIPGIEGSLQMCAFECTHCPPNMYCHPERKKCVPAQDVVPDVICGVE